MTYIIQTYLLADGWTDTWTEIDEHGCEHAVTFATQAEALRDMQLFAQERERQNVQLRVARITGDQHD